MVELPARKFLALAVAFLVLLAVGCNSTSSPPPPVITAFTAGAQTLYPGQATTLTPIFSDGTGTVNDAVGAVTSGKAVNIQPGATTTYTLTVVNSAGVSTTQATTVLVTDFKVGLSASTIPVTIGSQGTLSATVIRYDGGGAITVSLAEPPAGITGSITIPPAANSGKLVIGLSTGVAVGDYALTVQCSDSTYTIALPLELTATVAGAAPAIASFTASSTAIAAGGTLTLTPAFAGGTGIVDNGLGPVTSGTPVQVSPVGNTTYTLTVTDGDGASVHSTTPQVLVNQVSGLGLAVVSSAVSGGGMEFTGTVTGPGSFSQAFSFIDPGSNVLAGLTSGTYTVTANPWSSLALIYQQGWPIYTNQKVDVSAGTPIVNLEYVPSPCLTADYPSIPAGGSANLTARLNVGLPVSLSYTGSIDNGVGPIKDGVAVSVSPMVTTTYTLTTTLKEGTTTTSSVTITVLD